MFFFIAGDFISVAISADDVLKYVSVYSLKDRKALPQVTETTKNIIGTHLLRISEGY